MITLLKEYLAINTAHPHPDYRAVAALFKKHALVDGFLFREITLPSGFPVLIITMQGSSPELPALGLNHHMDVVPAENIHAWKFPPFAGAVDVQNIYGRGAQDCKGLGVVQYAALKQLKQSGIQPERTIHLIIVPDEERGGFNGAKQFIADPIFESLNLGYVLDEGFPSGDEKELLIKVDERTPLQIRVSSVGRQGHASELFHQNCIHDLNNFLADVIAFHTKQQQLATSDQAAHYISMNVTSLRTHHDALNVIPSQAQATIDIRIPSRLAVEEGINLIESLIEKHENISYEILATSQERLKAIKLDSIFYKTLARVIADHGLVPKPFAFEATTDARFYSHKGIQAIGFTPFTVAPNLHGIDESIRVNDVMQGTIILYNFLRAFCTIDN